MIDLQTQAYLTVLYSQQHRKYHNINHINDCLAELEKARSLCTISHHQYNIVETAIWFHDAVYNPYSSSNEENSAALLKSCVQIPSSTADEAIKAIHATKHHVIDQTGPQDLATKELTDLPYTTKLMLDIDLAGLGKDWKLFYNNSKNIQQEYYNTSYDDFCKGRIEFLRTLLTRKSLYYTDAFKSMYETVARNNIELELELLRSGNFDC